MKYETVKAKTLLSKFHSADSWFHVNRSLNAYRGCEHGCVYCDGMSESYYVDDFTSHIRIKDNADEVLRKELKKAGFLSQTELETETLYPFLSDEDAARLAAGGPRKQVIGVCGGVSDGYQPAEKTHKVTRRILETLLDYRMPVMVLTKSDLVLRDLDLLKEIHEVAMANVMFTITLADDETRQIFEPKAASTDERFDALREVRRAGLFGGVIAIPTIPIIGDSLENMTELAKRAKKNRAEFIQFGGMTLKPGRQKEHFLRAIERHFPQHLDRIRKMYSNNDRYGNPVWQHLPCNVMLRGLRVCQKVGIRNRSVRHRLPGESEENNRVLQMLLDIAFYLEFMLGRSWTEVKPYKELATRVEQGMPSLKELSENGQLEQYLNTDKRILAVVEEVLARGTCSKLERLVEEASHMTGTGTFNRF
ncbi:MAG: SPL family radical SAM protein [Candidatus Thorarchaeota archaeon]